MDNREIIQQSLNYIEDNLHSEITAAELAEQAGFPCFITTGCFSRQRVFR